MQAVCNTHAHKSSACSLYCTRACLYTYVQLVIYRLHADGQRAACILQFAATNTPCACSELAACASFANREATISSVSVLATMSYKPAETAMQVLKSAPSGTGGIDKHEMRRLNLLQVKAAVAAGRALILVIRSLMQSTLVNTGVAVSLHLYVLHTISNSSTTLSPCFRIPCRSSVNSCRLCFRATGPQASPQCHHLGLIRESIRHAFVEPCSSPPCEVRAACTHESEGKGSSPR